MNDNLINGPLNAFRLEGKIADTKKIIYLFGDIHNPISAETKCDSYTSIDFVKYFYETMKNTDKEKQFDFLFENYVDIDMFEQYKYSNYKYREKYLDEIRSYVDKDIDMKEKNKKIFNAGSKSFKNLRLHYLDVRSFYGASDICITLSNKIDDLLHNYNYGYEQLWMIDGLMINYINLKNELKFLLKHLYKKIYDKEINIKEKNDDILLEIKKEAQRYEKYIQSKESRLDKYSKKIFGTFHNKHIKETLMNSHIVDVLLYHIKKILRKIKSSIKLTSKLTKLAEYHDRNLYKREKSFYKNSPDYFYGYDYYAMLKINNSLKLKFQYIKDYLITVFAHITDLYFLRRLLDKNYIENAIVYTGMYHTQNYVKILIKNFNFIMTHASYSKYDIEKINKMIKNGEDDNFGIETLIYPQTLKQCGNMHKFPKNFN